MASVAGSVTEVSRSLPEKAPLPSETTLLLFWKATVASAVQPAKALSFTVSALPSALPPANVTVVRRTQFSKAPSPMETT